MDDSWDYILEIDMLFTEYEVGIHDELADELHAEYQAIRTPAYYAARKRRVWRLKKLIEAGKYWIDAERIAEGFLYGRPKWGEAFIDELGFRVDGG